jgi:hypothetical protein
MVGNDYSYSACSVVSFNVCMGSVYVGCRWPFARYILSGKLFSERFDIRHAGTVLDQPTIGKWLFWFTVMAVISFPYIIMLRRVSDRSNLIGRLAFAIPVAVICVLLLCILMWPLSWLVQYIHSMGFTPNRIFGLVYGTAAAIGVILFFIWAVRRSK